METENKHLYKYGSNKIKEIDIDLWNKINAISLDVSFKEKFYILENKLIDIPKCECGTYVKFIDMTNGYRSFCSKKCVYDSDKIKSNKKKTCIEKWGVDNPSKNIKIKEKVKKTNIEKFGHEWATKSEDIKSKMKNTFIENWGVDNPSKVKEVRDKARETMIEKWGVEHAMHSEYIKSKLKDKFIENWGVDNPSKVKEVRDKAKKTMIEKWGVEHALQNNDILLKSKKTLIEKWGVDRPLKNMEILNKMKSNNLEKWGVDIPSKSEEIKNKIKRSILEKYETLNLYEVEHIKNKIDKSNNERFGESHVSKNEDYRKRYKISNHENYIKYLENGISLFCCDKGESHNFEINIDNYIKRFESGIPLCTICNPIGDLRSIKENELYLFIKEIYNGKIIKRYRDSLEIDIFLPELGIGLEFNGLYWHSELLKDKKYHVEKTNYFKAKGIRIIHIWEDDWVLKRDIIKSQIKNWLKVTETKIFARKCNVKEITDLKTIKEFLNINHIQGYVNNVLALGLYNNDELVSLMTFDHYEGRKKMSNDEWNLNRFCNKLNTNVVGGASKLFSYFDRIYKPNRVVSYADIDWSTGSLYFTLGFNKIKESKPDYKYIINGKRVHKSRYKKSNLKDNYLNLSEMEYMRQNNINRIWDCGKIKFEIKV